MTSNVTGEGEDDDSMRSKKNHCIIRLYTATFEHRDENKTCSACRERERVNERVKFVKVVKAKECESDF